MFERYDKGARRAIFFARYEASNYGSRYIETEHLLLGLVREDHALARNFLGKSNIEAEIRAEIERRITRGERFSVSIEVPLTAECKRILNFAAEESERLAHRHVGTGHLLLGILRETGSLAANILHGRGLVPETVREQLSGISGPAKVMAQRKPAALRLDSFLTGLKWHNSEQSAPFFAENALFFDGAGKRWNREKILKEFETLFAPYAKRNAAYTIEETLAGRIDFFVAVVLWRNAILASEKRAWIHRMSLVLVPEGNDWAIILVQVTPVQPA